MKKLFVSMLVLAFFAITSLSAQRAAHPLRKVETTKAVAKNYELKGTNLSKRDFNSLIKSLEKSKKEYIIQEVRGGVVKTYSSVKLKNVKYLSESGDLSLAAANHDTDWYHKKFETLRRHDTWDVANTINKDIQALLTKYDIQPVAVSGRAKSKF